MMLHQLLHTFIKQTNNKKNSAHIHVTEPKHEVQTSHLELNTFQLCTWCTLGSVFP